MDAELKEIMDLAAKRGSRYIKGEHVISDLHAKMAELGILLLESARRLPELESSRKREALIELQNKIDDLRKSIFESKIQAL